MSQYYYLLSGLHEPIAENISKGLDLSFVTTHILEQLTPKDKNIFKYLVYQNDNKNLASVVAKTHELFSPYTDWCEPSIYDVTTLEHPNNHFSELPLYIQSFLDNDKNKDFTSIKDIEHSLFALFKDEIEDECGGFIVDYFNFMLDFKNIITAINLRMLEYSSEDIRSNLIGEGSLVEALTKSTSTDFGIVKEYPFVSKLIDTIEAKDPYALETLEMGIVFNYLNEYTSSKFFALENVLAHYIKCIYIDRLSKVDKEAGQEAIKTLMAEIKKKLDEVKI